MHALRIPPRHVRLPIRNATLIQCHSTAQSASMLSRAINSHASANRPKVQQPLHANNVTLNAQRSASQPTAEKRKFERTISTASSLGSLHNSTYFDENDFPDDLAIDLTNSPPRKQEVRYPKLDKVQYPELPPTSQSPSKNEPPRSSMPVPWSSSPPEHKEKPAPMPSIGQQLETTEERPKKKRSLPQGWQSQQTIQQSMSAPEDKTSKRQFWDKSAATLREQQKELRKRNTTKAGKLDPSKIPEDEKKLPESHLSEEQQVVARAVVEEGKSVFFTGSAGTGKSVLMRSIIRQLRSKYRRESDRLAITASTGLAACVIEGTTLHSWAGIGLGKEPAPELVKKIKRNAKTRQKWLRTKILIIDEVSMVDGELFDKLEHVARSIRNNGRPFGGIQLVVTGDFFQLPPVPERGQVAKFAFDAATWNTCIEHTILLTHVFRQKDPAFANMLNEMRLGKLSPASLKEFSKLSRPLSFDDDLEATELFPTRGEVDAANQARMARLSGAIQVYEAQDSGIQDLNVRNKILANFMAPERLVLKKGAQVMLIKNIDPGLVNGSTGKIVAFMDDATWSTYKEDEATYLTANGDGPDEDPVKKSAKAKFDAARFKHQDHSKPVRYWPMVRFPLPDGTFRDMMCQPEEWKTEGQQGEVVAKRVQVPLILAWALSIHKAQGQTLNRVKVDLGRTFERGQAYVALSRATSATGLQVTRFDARKVMVHPKVVDFYTKLINFKDITNKAEEKSKFGVNAIEIEDDDDDFALAAQG